MKKVVAHKVVTVILRGVEVPLPVGCACGGGTDRAKRWWAALSDDQKRELVGEKPSLLQVKDLVEEALQAAKR